MIVAWALVGLVLLLCVFFTSENGFSKISFSKQNNYAEELTELELTYSVQTEDYTEAYLYIGYAYKKMHYLRIEAEGLDRSASVNLTGGKVVDGSSFETSYTLLDQPLENGSNYYDLGNADYPQIVLEITGAGADNIKSIQLRESGKDIDVAKNMPAVLIAALIYLAVSALAVVLYRKRKTLKSTADSVIELRGKVPAILSGSRGSGIDPRAASVIRIILFFSMIFISLLFEMKAFGLKYNNDRGFRIYLLAQLIMILAAALLIPDGGLSSKPVMRLDKAALIVCTLLMLYTLASDLLVDKRFRFAGLGMFLVLLFFAYRWNRSGCEERLIKDFSVAVQIFMLVLVAMSLMGNKSIFPGQFSGPIENPSVYALYFGGMWAVLLGVLEGQLINGAGKGKKIFTIAKLVLCLMLVLIAQSMTPLLAVMAVTVLWIFRAVKNKKGIKTALKAMLIVFGAGLAMLVLLLIIAANTNVLAGSRVIEKITSADLAAALNGRDIYWRAYLRELNLLGHGDKARLWGRRILPHNSLIGMSYMYGVPCVIPYILMFIMAIEKSYRYADRKTPLAAVPFYAIVTFVIMSMADNVEQPFVWLPTIACYLLMAPILAKPVEDIDRSDS